RDEPLVILHEEEFIAERDASVRRQLEIEASDT
ncbi:glutamate--cysteine ligase, partial [Salmonella enterica subsp. enterica serovar Infantis]